MNYEKSQRFTARDVFIRYSTLRACQLEIQLDWSRLVQSYSRIDCWQEFFAAEMRISTDADRSHFICKSASLVGFDFHPREFHIAEFRLNPNQHAMHEPAFHFCHRTFFSCKSPASADVYVLLNPHSRNINARESFLLSIPVYYFPARSNKGLHYTSRDAIFSFTTIFLFISVNSLYRAHSLLSTRLSAAIDADRIGAIKFPFFCLSCKMKV